jgi:hypothetical protein
MLRRSIAGNRKDCDVACGWRNGGPLLTRDERRV